MTSLERVAGPVLALFFITFLISCTHSSSISGASVPLFESVQGMTHGASQEPQDLADLVVEMAPEQLFHTLACCTFLPPPLPSPPTPASFTLTLKGDGLDEALALASM